MVQQGMRQVCRNPASRHEQGAAFIQGERAAAGAENLTAALQSNHAETRLEIRDSPTQG